MSTTPPRNRPILNRDFKLPVDHWYQIEVRGEHFNAESNVVQVVDEKAVTAIVNRFAELKAQPNFAGVLIDRDHFSLDTSKESRAAGWLMDVRKSGEGYEGNIRWTKSGQEDVEGGDYRFFSTVYPPPDDCEAAGERKIANRKKPVRAVRPLELDRLAITNDPNNKGGKAISNRQPGASPERTQTQPKMKALLKKLGLAEDASEESAVAALELITNRATKAEADVGTITKERDELLDVQIERDLDTHKAVIKNRDSWKERLKKDRKGTLAILADLNPGDKKPITNRQGANPPKEGVTENDEAAQAAEQVRAAKISNRARALRASDKSLSLPRSYELAEAEIGQEEKK